MAKPTIYFDGACPICSREIAFYRRQQGSDALEWDDISACAGDPCSDLSRAAALARLHARDANGRLVAGAAAFALILQNLPRLAWLGHLLAWPRVLWLAERAYRGFLRIRPLWRAAEAAR